MEYPVNNKGTNSTDSCCADERKEKREVKNRRGKEHLWHPYFCQFFKFLNLMERSESSVLRWSRKDNQGTGDKKERKKERETLPLWYGLLNSACKFGHPAWKCTVDPEKMWDGATTKSVT